MLFSVGASGRWAICATGRFHDTILAIGSVPLPVLEEHIARFIASGLANAAKQDARNLSAIALVSSLAGLVLTVDTKTL